MAEARDLLALASAAQSLLEQGLSTEALQLVSSLRRKLDAIVSPIRTDSKVVSLDDYRKK